MDDAVPFELDQQAGADILRRAGDLRAQVAANTAPCCGLCIAVLQTWGATERRWLFADWPEYSGDLCYPVPAPGDFETDPDADDLGTSPAEQAFDRALAYDTLYVGEYGAARLRLLDHIEAKLRALLCDLLLRKMPAPLDDAAPAHRPALPALR